MPKQPNTSCAQPRQISPVAKTGSLPLRPGPNGPNPNVSSANQIDTQKDGAEASIRRSLVGANARDQRVSSPLKIPVVSVTSPKALRQRPTGGPTSITLTQRHWQT